MKVHTSPSSHVRRIGSYSSTTKQHLRAAPFFITLFLSPLSAWGYCRTTTCDLRYSCATHPADCCILDENECDTNGKPLSWPSSCVSYSIQVDGSEKRAITKDQLAAVVDTAFQTWLEVNCNQKTVSLSAERYPDATCDQAEYNSNDGNANVWMFRDKNWSGDPADPESGGFDASALAVTTVTFAPSSAAIYDVDVELNSDQASFTLPDQAPRADLLSIVTHEAGHFLGLNHSLHNDATMYYSYRQFDTSQRTLNDDDVAGICATYPEGRELLAGNSCEPIRGFIPECGDGVSNHGGCVYNFRLSTAPRLSSVLVFLALGGAAVLRRRAKLSIVQDES